MPTIYYLNSLGLDNKQNLFEPDFIALDEIRAKLQFLTEKLESHSNSRPVTARNVEQRLARLRAEITDIVRNEARPLCNCRQITVVAGQTLEEFEAEMKLTCPIHGLRRLGVVVHLGSLPPDHDDRRIGELIKTYSRSMLEFGGKHEC